jgi:NAD(P)-dependent dehydrogenase (short-subunit alcohol dehydrogenase family)
MKAPGEEATPEQLVSLAGRVAVVTGGATGIGLATARRFAQAGASVLIGDLDAKGAAEVADRLDAEHGTGATVVGRGVDVSSEESVNELMAAAVERFGRLDVCANFAAVYPMTADELVDVLEFPIEEWEREISVNLTGSFICSRAAARRMVEAGNGGVIINTSTTVVDRYPGHRGMIAYATSKGAIEQLTMMLAAELGPRGVRAVAVKPTVIETPGMQEHMGSVAEVMGADEAFGELREVMPLRRFGSPDEVARIVLFAASDQAAFLTGSVIAADGGELTI